MPSKNVVLGPSDLLEVIISLDRDRDLSWKKLGDCNGSDSDMFFPERRSSRLAKAICRECPVQDECLEYAIETGQNFGIWGGQGVKARRRIREERDLKM